MPTFDGQQVPPRQFQSFFEVSNSLSSRLTCGSAVLSRSCIMVHFKFHVCPIFIMLTLAETKNLRASIGSQMAEVANTVVKVEKNNGPSVMDDITINDDIRGFSDEKLQEILRQSKFAGFLSFPENDKGLKWDTWEKSIEPDSNEIKIWKLQNKPTMK